MVPYDLYSHGRLYRLVRGYYIFTQEYPSGRLLRRVLNVFSPVLNWLLSGLYRVRQRGRSAKPISVSHAGAKTDKVFFAAFLFTKKKTFS